MGLNKHFTKTEALKLMLEGFKMVETTTLSKKQYQGEYCIYDKNKFKRVEYKQETLIDPNQLIDKYWSYAELTPRMIPHRVYKTNLKIGTVITLDYNKILKQGIDRDKNLWAIVYFKGSDDSDHTVKMVYKMHPSITRKQTLNDHMMFYEQNNIYDVKRTANYVLKCFVEEETLRQRKRAKNKKELETMKTVRAIIKNHPEILV